MVFNNNTQRWKKMEEEADRNNKWTEVVSKKKHHHHQQQQQQPPQQQHHQTTEGRDPFAGMKSCVDYEQEIERLKQLVPKVPAVVDSQHKKRPSLERKLNTNSSSNTHITTNPTTHTTHPNFFNNDTNNTSNTNTIASISRSNSPDTTHSSDSDTSSLPDQIVTEEEKLRFLAFVRSWTGDWRKGAIDDLNSSTSLWADQSPWSRRHHVQTQPYYSYQQPATMLNKHGQQPIGMGRKTHQSSFGYAL